jgi:hypothetical protein
MTRESCLSSGTSVPESPHELVTLINVHPEIVHRLAALCGIRLPAHDARDRIEASPVSHHMRGNRVSPTMSWSGCAVGARLSTSCTSRCSPTGTRQGNPRLPGTLRPGSCRGLGQGRSKGRGGTLAAILPRPGRNAINLSGPGSVPMAPTVPLQRAVGANGPVRACRWRHPHAAGRYEPVLKWQMVRAGQPTARPGSPGAPSLCTMTARGYLRHHQPPGPPAHTTANQPKWLKLTALVRGDNLAPHALEQIRACTDPALLADWQERAYRGETSEQIFGASYAGRAAHGNHRPPACRSMKLSTV